MHIVAGIDEAGLGPLLGPLTLGYAALRSPYGARELWQVLEQVVASDPSADRSRLVVADSKKVFTRDARGHARLERTALCFLAQRDGGLGLLRNASALLRAPAPERLTTSEPALPPWEASLDVELPLWNQAGELEHYSSRLRQALCEAQIEVAAAGVLAIPVGRLNASFKRTGSKGTTLWLYASDLVAELWQTAQDPMELWLDRQGGRTYYGNLLQARFPLSPCQSLREESARAEYLLHSSNRLRDLHLVVTPKAEDNAFPVALASCLAKYGRELAMHAFNSYWARHAPGVRPTAGYVTDARRWLLEAEPMLRGGGVARESLVRER